MGSLGEQFGSNLHQLRRRAQLSQIDLGAVSGLHRQRIGYMENGVQVPRLDSILKLSAGLNASPCELLEGLYWIPGGYVKGGFRVEESHSEIGGGPR